MRKFKFILLLCSILCVGTVAAQDTAVTEPQVEQSDDNGSIAEAETPAWLTAICTIASALLGIWGGRTQFADKTGKEKAKWKGKVDALDGVLDDILNMVRSGAVTPAKVSDIATKGKAIISKPE